MPINPTIKDQIIKNNPVGILFFLIFPFLFEQHDIWHHSVHPFDFSLLIGIGMAIYTLLSWIYVLKTSSGPDINTKFIILSSVTGAAKCNSFFHNGFFCISCNTSCVHTVDIMIKESSFLFHWCIQGLPFLVQPMHIELLFYKELSLEIPPLPVHWLALSWPSHSYPPFPCRYTVNLRGRTEMAHIPAVPYTFFEINGPLLHLSILATSPI